MIWDTLIWRLECSNRSKIRSAQKCNPCLRYELSPMSPGRTRTERIRLENFEPKTIVLRENRELDWRGVLRLVPVFAPALAREEPLATAMPMMMAMAIMTPVTVAAVRAATIV